MATWDVVMFCTEMDLMKVRFRELEDYVDHFVVVEARTTHRGAPKPLWFEHYRKRYLRWERRIIHVTADLPDTPDPWIREHAQRDAALPVLQNAEDDDLVLICDADEFPSVTALETVPRPAAALSMRMAMYAVDWLYPQRHLCSVIATAGHVKEQGTLAGIRDGRDGLPVIEDGGWHFTWLGGPFYQRQKLEWTCHTEMTEFEASLIRKGRCWREGIHHSGKFRMIPADVDETWPKKMQEHRCPASWYRPRPEFDLG